MKIQFAPGQPLEEAVRVDIEESKEPFAEYTLADGTKLRVKQVAMEVWRLTEKFDPEGNPFYFLKSAGLMVVEAPAGLKRKAN